MSRSGSEAFLQRVRMVGDGDEVFVHFEGTAGGEAEVLLGVKLDSLADGTQEGFVHLNRHK